MSTDEKALKAAIEILGKHDTHYSEWSLDEGHLRSFIADYEAAKASGQPREWETPQSTHEGPCVGYGLNAEGKFICEQCSAAKLQPVGNTAREAWQKYAEDKNIDLTVREMVVTGHTEYEQVYTDGCYEAFLSGFWAGQKVPERELVAISEDEFLSLFFQNVTHNVPGESSSLFRALVKGCYIKTKPSNRSEGGE